jgi:hypothetical protein
VSFDITRAQSYVVIIRTIHERGGSQAAALAELNRRGLWLTTDQRRQAGLPLTADQQAEENARALILASPPEVQAFLRQNLGQFKNWVAAARDAVAA